MRRQLGELFIESAFIHHEQLDEVLAIQKNTHERIGQILLRMGYIREIDLAKVLALQLNLAYDDLKDVKFFKNAAALVPREAAKRHNILPLKITEEKLSIAMSDPTDFYAIEEIRATCDMDFEIRVAAKNEIKRKIHDVYERHETELVDTKKSAVFTEQEERKDDGEALSIMDLVDRMINRAIRESASDIHMEPLEDTLRVRFRIDGILREYFSFGKQIQPAILSRVKIIGALDIVEKRMPQDGRSHYHYDGNEIDLRISTLPTILGEKIVIRILNKAYLLTKIDTLGFSRENLTLYSEMYRSSHGMILLVGPTGSGKSTTLYATLKKLNDAEKNIITIENPVEYRLSGINQMQTNEKNGLTFAACLRAVLRQDPNIIMIGEIRDQETAEISIRASLTGHLIFSTGHVILVYLITRTSPHIFYSGHHHQYKFLQ